MSTVAITRPRSRGRSSQRARVLVMSTEPASFVETDVALLRRHFDVEAAIGSGLRRLPGLVRRAMASDVSISWFASVYTSALVAAALVAGRRSIVILGGVDTARDETIGYGIWRSAWRRPLLRWALRRASRVVAVDAALVRALAASSGLDDLPIDVIPTGYDPTYWSPGNARDGSVLAVAGCATEERALVKGVDLFVEAARRLPHVPFVLVGADARIVERLSPPANLHSIGRIDRARLRELYRRASVFCLPSRHEGLPNALCEAMLCGCVPVGARVGAVDDVIGPCGEIVEPGDATALAAAITRALAADDGLRDRARERVIEQYPVGRREARLVALVGELLDA